MVKFIAYTFSSLLPFTLFNRSVVSDSLRPHRLQHTRLSFPSPAPGAYSNSCSSSRWCHPTISSSVSPFSAFSLSQLQGLFQWVGSLHQVAKLLGASASASVLPVNIQDWFPLGLTGLISLLSNGLSGIFSRTIVWRQVWHSNYLLQDFLSGVFPLPDHPTNHC